MTEERMRIVSVILIFIFIGVIIVGFLYGYKPILDKSSLPAAPVASIDQAKTPDPVIDKWRTYSNPLYRFTITVPELWYAQDYAAMHPEGGTLIAFSPDPLPCANCSYIKNGYLSLRIFNKQTAPEYYSLYAGRMNELGKNKEYQQIMIGDKKGLLSGNSIAVENDNWVYEFSLDKANGTAKIDDTEIFQRVVNSLTFQDDGLDL